MAVNSLYPGFVIIKYAVSTRPHRMVLPVLPDLQANGNWDLTQKDSLTGHTFWQTLVQNWLNVIDERWEESAISISTAELWTMDSPTADPVYRDAFSPADPVGTSNVTVAYSENVMTFRTEAGGILRIYQMETVSALNAVHNAPLYDGVTSAQAILAFLLDDDGFIVGRDGSFPVAGHRLTTKTNDALRKKYLLS